MFIEKDIEGHLKNKNNFSKAIYGHDYDEFSSANMKIYNQVRVGSYGIIDLLAVIPHKNLDENDCEVDILQIDIVEIKMAETASYVELAQLCRYMTALDMYLHHSDIKRYALSGYLLCRGINMADDFAFLYNSMGSKISIITFNVNLNAGIKFDHDYKEYKNSDEGSLISDLNKIITLKTVPKSIKKLDIVDEAKKIVSD